MKEYDLYKKYKNKYKKIKYNLLGGVIGSIDYDQNLFQGERRSELDKYLRNIRRYTKCTSRMDGFNRKTEEQGKIIISGNEEDCNIDNTKQLIRNEMTWLTLDEYNFYPSDHPLIYSEFNIHGHPLSIYSWNCNLQGPNFRHYCQDLKEGFFQAVHLTILNLMLSFKRERPDIILLQEYKASDIYERKKCIQDYKRLGYIFVTSNLYGVCTLINENIELIPHKDIDQDKLSSKLIKTHDGEFVSYKDSTASNNHYERAPFGNKRNKYTHYPPMTYYRDNKGIIKVGKNTSLDIVIKLNDVNIKIRNIHLDAKYSELSQNFLETEEHELLIIGGDFNAQDSSTSRAGINDISVSWKPKKIRHLDLTGFKSLGIWNDGFVFSNTINVVSSEVYMNNPEYKPPKDKQSFLNTEMEKIYLYEGNRFVKLDRLWGEEVDDDREYDRRRQMEDENFDNSLARPMGEEYDHRQSQREDTEYVPSMEDRTANQAFASRAPNQEWGDD